MPNEAVLSTQLSPGWNQSGPTTAASITRAASKQSYYIVRFLVDRDRIDDAYRAYAYFRWVDDYLDHDGTCKSDGLAFVHRQQALLDGGYRNEWSDQLTAEESMLADLVQGDTEANSGLRAYLQCMMAVMDFDARRRGELMLQQELDEYTHQLAKAVTEALHYFIGHDQPPPQDDTRYLAATAAHITHMLRDAIEDAAIGYYNIPREVLDAHGIGPLDVESAPYRNWVRSRVQFARQHFKIGLNYLNQVENRRCRLAGYLYMGRFETVLDSIERDDYRLRASYPECKTMRACIGMGRSMLTRNFLR